MMQNDVKKLYMKIHEINVMPIPVIWFYFTIFAATFAAVV